MRNVVDYLKESYSKYPDSVACADEIEEITYKELWEESELIANRIICNGDGIGPVAIIAHKSIQVLKIIWAIIKSGKCYTIIDPMLPRQRIKKIIDVLQPEMVISSIKYKDKLDSEIKFFDIEEIIKVDENSLTSTENRVIDTRPLYIMFTSGSTGTPKGVVVNHRSVVDFIDEFVETFDITNRDIIGNQAPWDFDISVKDIFSAAKTGAKLQIIPRKYFSFPAQLVEFLDDKNVTTLIWAVSALRIVSTGETFDHRKPKSINKIIFSGEVMPAKHYNIWRKQYPNALFANVYGPTEITCNCTYYIQKGIIDEDAIIPIGKAFNNENVFLLDENDKLISENEFNKSGEICVSGTAVTMGYYADPEMTDMGFVQNPLNNKYTEIIYRTGDIAKYNEFGQLVYVGRKDNQIKLNGHRIELGEIEKAINSVHGVMVSCCIYQNEEIIAFVEGKEDIKEEIIHELKKVFPNYMIPRNFIFLNSMPLNDHGKIDRHSLKTSTITDVCD